MKMKLKDNMSTLEQYKEFLKNKNSSSFKSTQSTFDLKLEKGINSIKLKVFDGLNIGANGKNTCSINQLIKHIEYVKNTPNCYAVLGGDLFYSFTKQELLSNTSFDTANQIDILTQLFEPIKDKIISVVSGKNEALIKNKEMVDPTKVLAKKLDILNRYNSSSVVSTITFNNAYTGFKPMNVSISTSYLKTTAKTYATIYNKSVKQGKMHGLCDINITTGTHSNLKADSKVHDYSSRLGDLVKKPHYEYNSSGYCMWNKNGEGPYFIDDNILDIYIAKNLDADIVQGTNQIAECDYKVFCDIEPIGKQDYSKAQYNLIADYYATRKHNEELIESIIEYYKSLKKELDNNTEKSLFDNLNK